MRQVRTKRQEIRRDSGGRERAAAPDRLPSSSTSSSPPPPPQLLLQPQSARKVSACFNSNLGWTTRQESGSENETDWKGTRIPFHRLKCWPNNTLTLTLADDRGSGADSGKKMFPGLVAAAAVRVKGGGRTGLSVCASVSQEATDSNIWGSLRLKAL